MTDAGAPPFSGAPAARSALIVGLGTLGAPLALQLARSGVWHLTLVDPDVVEDRNLGAQPFGREHVGSYKVHAVAEQIARIGTCPSVVPWAVDIRQIGLGTLSSYDLLLSCPDNRAAEFALARAASLLGKPSARLATRGSARVVDVTSVPAPRDSSSPCGLCQWTSLDRALAQQKESCLSEIDRNPDAGSWTTAAHGSLAAGLANELWSQNEFEPARLIRWCGGQHPRIETTLLQRSTSCPLEEPPFGHGPHSWSWSSARSVGEVLGQARTALGTEIERMAVELDVPLSRQRTCERCVASFPAAFWCYSRAHQERCPRCDQPLKQIPALARRRLPGAELRTLARRTFRSLRAPRGLGLRFALPGGVSWNVFVNPAPSEARPTALGGPP